MKMIDIWLITLYGLMIGTVGTGLGGFASLLIRDKSNSGALSFLLGLTGGFMLYIVTFQLLAESFTLGGLSTSIVGILLGILLIILMESYINTRNINQSSKISLVFAMSIAAHNFPEGIALGSSFFTLSNLGPIISISMLLHNIPEGMAMALTLKVHKVSSSRIVLYTILAGVPTGIGAFIGAYMGSVSNSLISLSLSLAAGAMLYMICDEILPNAKTLHKGRASTIGVILGFILGMLI